MRILSFNTMPGMRTVIRKLIHFGYFFTRYRKKPKYGTRYLVDKSKIFSFNSWDDVEWDETQEKEAFEKVQSNSIVKFTDEDIQKYERDSNKFWDTFYDIHDNKFFKDRHWLFTEFPELANAEEKECNIFELGCGVGNTIFPILQCNQDKELKVFGCDFSEKALNILKESDVYDINRCTVFVLDISEKEWSVPFEESSIDIIVMIFVLSAISPEKYKNVVLNIYKYLKPGGIILFRDYGRYDLAQLRFKPGRSLGDNFYVRGDGTRVYFFTQDEVRSLFDESGFVEKENKADRRLQVNRGRLIKMYRVWIQAKYQKPK